MILKENGGGSLKIRIRACLLGMPPIGEIEEQLSAAEAAPEQPQRLKPFVWQSSYGIAEAMPYGIICQTAPLPEGNRTFRMFSCQSERSCVERLRLLVWRRCRRRPNYRQPPKRRLHRHVLCIC